MGFSRIKRYLVAVIVLFVFWGAGDAAGFELTKFYEGFKPGDHRLEIRDLGFEHADLIVADESAITSLVETPNGQIYGGTTGRACHLFVFMPLSQERQVNRMSNWVKHLGKISGHESIHHSIVASDDGTIYFGTGLNEIEQHPISEPFPPGKHGIVKSLWGDIKKRYDKYKGGHLYRYDISKEKRTWIKNDDEIIAEDLGVAVPHNGIYALTVNNERQEIYGLTYPDGHFFVYYIKRGEFKDIGSVYKEKIYAGPDNRTLRTMSRALVCDNEGYVYGCGDKETIFRFDPEKKKIEMLDLKIPFVYFSTVEVFVKDKNGMIYGGTSEGYLFKFDTEKMKVSNLGKPYAQGRMRALTIKKGMIYGIGGQRDNHCRMFSYCIAKGEFDDLGVMRVARDPYYLWMGKQFDAMLTSKDGIIYAGESERRSHLFLYYP